jgi:hypothetical protein
VRNILWDIVLNATIPLLLYKVSKRYISHSELLALLIATTFPLVKNVIGFTRHRQLDPVSILVLLGIVTSCIALLLGGDPRILLVRESLFSGVLGVACIASLLLRRPMMFYFGRYFMAGNDPFKREKFDATWQWPDASTDHNRLGNCLRRRICYSRALDLHASRYLCFGDLADSHGDTHHLHPALDFSICAPTPKTARIWC